MRESLSNPDAAVMFRDLKQDEDKGRAIYFNGAPASPLQVAHAYTLREDCTFMKYYGLDEKGDVEEVHVDAIKIGRINRNF